MHLSPITTDALRRSKATEAMRLTLSRVASAADSPAFAIDRVARILTDPGANLAYENGARGPHAYDNLGFVRACVQGAADWKLALDKLGEPIADIARPYSADGPRIEDQVDLLLLWGFEVDRTRTVRPGDILQLWDRPCRLAVAISFEEIAVFDVIAGPKRLPLFEAGRQLVKVYRLPAPVTPCGAQPSFDHGCAS